MTNNLPKSDVVLDTLGRACPVPLLLAHRSLKKLDKGQSLLLLSDDPTTSTDIEGWRNRLGYQSVQEIKSKNSSAFLIIK